VLLIAALWLGACTGAGSPAPTADSTTPPPSSADEPASPRPIPPEAGATADGFIHEGETVVHTVHLEEGDYLKAHLDRSPYKVRFRLDPPGDPDEVQAIGWGELCADPPGQTLWGLAAKPGDYRLTAKLHAKGPPGPYRITLLALHPAGRAEHARQAGQVEWELGVSAYTKGHFQTAIDHFRRSHDLWVEADYLRGVAATNGRIGQSFTQIDRFDEAVPYLEKAISLWDEAGDSKGVAANLTFISSAETERHNWAAAESAARRALKIAREDSLPATAGYALAGLCALERARGRTREALEQCTEAVEFWEGLDDSSGVINPLAHLGVMHRRMGEFDLARSDYNRLLEILRDHPDPVLEAGTHNNLGTLHYTLGEYQQALVEYQTALAMYEDQGNTAQVAQKYYSIGTVYQRMGDLGATLSYYEKARELQEHLERVQDLASTLLGIGWVHILNGRPELAVDPITRALDLSRSTDAKPLMVLALRRMGFLRLAQDRPADAMSLLEEGLRLARETQDRWEEAALLNRRASAELQLNRPEDALQTLQEAATVDQQIGNQRDLARSLYRIAQIYRNEGEPAAALEAIKKALMIAAEARDQIQVQQIRSLVGATQQELHGFYIDILMDLAAKEARTERATEAFHAVERARAKSLLEVLSTAELGSDANVPPKLLSEREDIRHKLATAELRRAEILEARRTPDQDALFQLKLELDRLTTALDEVERKMRAASPAYADLTRPEVTSVEQVQRNLLDQDTALLEFRLGERRSFLFLITPDAFRTFELPARHVLEEDARCIHWLLTSFTSSDNGATESKERAVCLGPAAEPPQDTPSRNPFEERARHRRLVEQAFAKRAAMLSTRLLGKAFHSGLLANRRLAVVTDGALEYVPFAALPEPGTDRPLVVNHELAMLPSASVLAFQRREKQPGADPHRTLAVIADPLYGESDERVARTIESADRLRNGLEGAHYARLPYASEEASSIAALAPAKQTLVELGANATKESILGTSLEGYRYIHFAVHGVIDSDFPALSRLVLSQVDAAGRPVADGSLRLHDIYDMKLDAQMVVLSACDTALGQEIRGEGLVGLARGFMYAGARRVVASLWRVQDRATATLMERFYRGLLEEHRDPADALRQAQLAMLSEDGGRYSFPYYWAGFVLQGDWR